VKTNATAEMEYNSSRPHLVISEYGRNVQRLIRHARTIENKEERQIFIEKIVDLMMQMSSQSKNLDDYRERLWRHVFRIAEYNLDVDTPMGKIPTSADDHKKPEIVDYPKFEAKFKHYGHNVQKLVNKAIQMEEGPIKDGFVEVIANYMKLAYRTWNREHFVSDKIIIEDLGTLSSGNLQVDEETSLDTLANANRKKQRVNLNNSNNNSRSNNNNNSTNNSNRNRNNNKKRGRKK
jgi:hypothetical protein